MSDIKLDKRKLVILYFKAVIYIIIYITAFLSILYLIATDYTVITNELFRIVVASFLMVFIILVGDFTAYRYLNRDNTVFSKLYNESIIDDDKGNK